MAYAEGQQVRLKQGLHTGTIHRKLAHLADMYVVQLDSAQTPVKKLAHEAEIEPWPPQDRFSA